MCLRMASPAIILHADLLSWLQSLPPVVVKAIEQSNDERNSSRA